MPLMLYGFNWIDIFILLFLTLAVIEGLRIGFLAQVFGIVGFFVTLFLAGWLFPHLLPIHDQTVRTIVNAGLVLLAAIFAGMGGSNLGQNMHWSFRFGRLSGSRKLETVETILGSLPAIAAGLTLIWLLGVAVGRMPFVGFSNSVSDSIVIQLLTRSLPPVPAVFAEFDRQVNPNAEPYVFTQSKPEPSFDYSTEDVQLAGGEAAASVVRITSFSCGGITGGSGFVAGKDLVVTNAHVIAGSKLPVIKYRGSSYEGVPVYFDPNIDLAILRVEKLKAPLLLLAANDVVQNSTVAVLGYPGGNYRAAPGIVRDTFAVNARSIYDQGAFGRGVYVVQTSIAPGSSGGPVVLENGQVAGVIFSESTDVSDTAYALNSTVVLPALHKAESSYVRVSAGACME